MECYFIDSDQYTRILDLVIDSKPNHNIGAQPFACKIACKVNSITNVQVFDIYSPKVVQFISYVKSHGELKVFISDDMMTTFLSIS